MCLFPRKMINRKYTETIKNGGCIPDFPLTPWGDHDTRVRTVEIPCGCCIECREERANGWRIRMIEELKITEKAYFVTFTFSPEELKQLCYDLKTEYAKVNVVAKLAIRRFLERYRKKYHHSLKHWFTTELGHKTTERLHIHGIIFTDNAFENEFERIERRQNGWMCQFKFWKYGHVFLGDWCNEQTINYIVKYLNKLDTDHKTYKSIILCSPGIGKNWLNNSNNLLKYSYEKGNTKVDYQLNNGKKVKLPTYYKNYLYDENERELIWRDSLDKGETVILGVRHSMKELSRDQRTRIKEKAQETNLGLGYGSDSREWRQQDYNVTLQMIRKWAKDEVKKNPFRTWDNEFAKKNT